MAKKPLPKAAEPYKFKPGQSGNPNGGRAHNPAVKALSKLTVETYREVIELVLTGNLQAIQDMIKDPNTVAIQVGVATAFMKAIRNGDYDVIERIAQRIVGKIPDQINIHSQNANTNTNLHGVIDREKLKAAMKLIDDDV